MEGEQLRHPRAVAAFRVGIYVALAVLLAFVVGTTVTALGTLALAAGVFALAVGDAGLLAVGVVAVVALAVVVATVVGLVVGARRLERRVVAADRRPDPVAVAKDSYVRGDVDEHELDRRLEAAIDGTPPDRSRATPSSRDADGRPRSRLRRDGEPTRSRET